MQIDIGTQIQVSHRGEVIHGRIVGIESSSQRHGFPSRGHVVVLQPQGDREPLEVYVPPTRQTRS